MKGMKFGLLLIVITAMGTGIALGGREVSVDTGKTLFNDPKLGTSGKVCNSCHVDGKGLEKAGNKPNLTDIINGCITTPLKGTALEATSVEMQSLVLYIKSIGEKAPAAKKKAPVGC